MDQNDNSDVRSKGLTHRLPWANPQGRGILQNPSGRFDAWRREEDPETPQPVPVPTRWCFVSNRTLINDHRGKDLPFEQSINPYQGCEHGCVYCFARATHAYWGLGPGLDFETKILVKSQVGPLLFQALTKKSYRVATMAMGTNTDPYQPLERQLTLTRTIVQTLAQCRHPLMITTKSALILRDLDLLKEMAQRNLIAVWISLTSLERRMASSLEPRAASPARRLEIIGRLRQAGIPVGMMVAPVLPGLTDHELETLVAEGQRYGAGYARCDLVRFPVEVWPLFDQWLQEALPSSRQAVISKMAAYGVKGAPNPHSEGQSKVLRSLLHQRMARLRTSLKLAEDPGSLSTHHFNASRLPNRQGEVQTSIWD
jgi:DNA repair photolyase